LLVHLPARLLASVSVLVIVLHNLADPISAKQFGHYGWLWNVLHQPGVFPVGPIPVLVAYPLIPWIAVMSAGFCFAPVLTAEPATRRRWLIMLGLALTAAFVLMRAINGYGDPRPWSGQIPGMTILSFLRTNKYPPSLDFLLMTLGPAVLLLGLLDRLKLSSSNPVIVFGRVPLFFFVLHLYLIHAAAFPLALIRYGRAGFLLTPQPSLGGDPRLYPANYGYDLVVVYLIWIAIVMLLYPVCRWYGRTRAATVSRALAERPVTP